jgi:hypothetical protein
MHTVNSTQRPKFEDDDLAAQILEPDRLVGADGVDGAVELGRLEAVRQLSSQGVCGQAYQEQSYGEGRQDGAEAASESAGREEKARHERAPLRAKDNHLG